MTFKTEADQPDIPGIDESRTRSSAAAWIRSSALPIPRRCSVAEVDVLTGEVKILSSDIVYDMGWSMNPALDIGQVEGAFVQGIGYLLTEKLVFEPSGDEKGRLNTTNTWRYKIPAVTTIPLEMNTYLFPRDLGEVHPGGSERHLLREGSRRASARAGQQCFLRHQSGHPRLAHRARARPALPLRRAGHGAGSAAGLRGDGERFRERLTGGESKGAIARQPTNKHKQSGQFL